MVKLNIGKVLLGGIIAGLVINVSQSILNLGVIAEDSEAAMQQLGLTMPGGAAIAIFMLMGLLLGILAVWLYAAIRPRYGPGPRTALLAGAVAWALSYGLRTLDYLATGLWPSNLIVIGVLWGFVEMAVAVVIGARFYSEPSV